MIEISGYLASLLELPDCALADPLNASELAIAEWRVGGRQLRMAYAPFDHVNVSAKVVIMGLTPGRRQAVDALVACRDALRAAATRPVALARAKAFASFSGPMRRNLVKLLDGIGLPALLGVGSSAELWTSANGLVHFTSAIRYPLFVDGKNWSGIPDPIGTSELLGWIEALTGPEVASLSDAVFVPLGSKVQKVLMHLVALGCLDGDRVLKGLPHPSGANAERIACFLEEKPVAQASRQTNACDLVRRRAALIGQVEILRTRSGTDQVGYISSTVPFAAC